jgi:hypothetical protein
LLRAFVFSPAAQHPRHAVASRPLFLVWMINLYNFMDGMDGFAAGMAGIGFGLTPCWPGRQVTWSWHWAVP